MDNIKNKSNTELNSMKKELSDEFDRVRLDLIKLYSYWLEVEKKYIEIHNELNDRFGINNK